MLFPWQHLADSWVSTDTWADTFIILHWKNRTWNDLICKRKQYSEQVRSGKLHLLSFCLSWSLRFRISTSNEFFMASIFLPSYLWNNYKYLLLIHYPNVSYIPLPIHIWCTSRSVHNVSPCVQSEIIVAEIALRRRCSLWCFDASWLNGCLPSQLELWNGRSGT